MKPKQTHETFITAVSRLVIARAPRELQAPLAEIKLLYGIGADGIRGVTYYAGWKSNQAIPLIEVTARGEESWIQLAGTTVHELAHVAAGLGAGHSTAWRTVAAQLGLRRARAAGHQYTLAGFEPDLRAALVALERPCDGQPTLALPGGTVLRPCGAGIGTRGGHSRGIGSGSRMKLYMCECAPAVRVRHAGTTFHAHCDSCHAPFKRAE